MIAIGQILSNLPFLALWLVAGVLAMARWDKHPTASALVLVAAGISVMTRIASVALPIVLRERGMDMVAMSSVFTAVGLVGTVGLACLIAAVFVDRDARNGPPAPPFR